MNHQHIRAITNLYIYYKCIFLFISSIFFYRISMCSTFHAAHPITELPDCSMPQLASPFPPNLTHSCFSPHNHNFKLYGLDRQRKENSWAGSSGRRARRPGRTEKTCSALVSQRQEAVWLCCTFDLHLIVSVTDWPRNELRLIRDNRDALGLCGSYCVIQTYVHTGLVVMSRPRTKWKWMDSNLVFSRFYFCIVELLFFPSVQLVCRTEDIRLLAHTKRTEHYFEGQQVKHSCRAVEHICSILATGRLYTGAFYCIMLRFSITHAAWSPGGTQLPCWAVCGHRTMTVFHTLHAFRGSGGSVLTPRSPVVLLWGAVTLHRLTWWGGRTGGEMGWGGAEERIELDAEGL